MHPIRLELHIAPSRHRREKALIVEALRGQRELARIQPIEYRATIEFYGRWKRLDGSHLRRDGDSPVIPLFDAIQELTGVDDSFYNQHFSVECYPSERESVVITLVPI